LVLLLINLVANRQFRTAFGAAAGNQFAAALGAHAATKTVLVYTTALGGLERSFHGSLFLARLRIRAERFVKGRKDKRLKLILQNTLLKNISDSSSQFGFN